MRSALTRTNQLAQPRYDLRSTLALILAGGVGSRLNVLVRRRAKPAVPFGGIYRIIDFTLSNVMNSGIERAGILTQYMPYSLTKHLGLGDAWGLVGRSREIRILPPHTGTGPSDWYQGTADAVFRNLSYVARHAPEIVLILSGDHIYYMDYAALIEAHINSGAAATIAVKEIPIEEAHFFGTVQVDEHGWVTGFEEKPERPASNLISLGIYAFNADLLVRVLEEVCGGHSRTDFARDVFPFTLGRDRIGTYHFGGYWQDVGTIKAFFDANMELLEPGSPLDLPRWGVRTNLFEGGDADHAPAMIARGARVRHATLARGCRIRGDVADSILSPGVIVAEGATVRDSILMHETRIEAGAVVKQAILDKQVVVGRDARIGDAELGNLPNRVYPSHLDQGITVIGKGAVIPERCRIGHNCSIFPGARLASLEIEKLPSGETVEWETG